MCGIAGEARFDHRPPSAQTIRLMLDHLKERGPDGSGMFVSNSVAFGHRRLKIIDLSEASNQPMSDPGLGLTLVYNGALYNYTELRDRLRKKGYAFKSSGDTEVILKAYDAWGSHCVQHFDGMFAFAIYDEQKKHIFAARDRLGIKPFYYQLDGSKFRFASFLPALIKAAEVSPTINPVALNHFMCFRTIVGEHTIFNEFNKLPPATTLTVRADGRSIKNRYWEMDFSRTEEEENRSEAGWIALVESALENAVRKRLTADVPVGVLLSGGLDSSLIVGLMSKMGMQNVPTFSIGFEDVGSEIGDEFKYSDIIAKEFNTVHHKIFADDAMLRENLAACIKAMAEPMVSHDVIAFYLLSREVSKHIKVVQSGQGADEVFAGYRWYPPLFELQNGNAAQIYADNYFTSQFKDFRRAVHPRFVQDDFALGHIEQFFQQSKAETAIDKTLHLDITEMMPDDPVKRLDNMSMAWGLEARVPFLDHEVIELASKIPARFKLKNGGKYILQETARRVIPHEVIDRPKGYFPVPALRHMQGSYLELAKTVFSGDSAKKQPVFNPDYIQDLLSAPQEHITPFGSKLWQATLLQMWLHEHWK